MKTQKAALVSLLLSAALFLGGCGMMIGQMMVAGTGIKEFKVVKGDLSAVPRGSKVLVLAPFETRSGAYEPARGDFAASLAEELSRIGALDTAFHFAQKPGEAKKLAKELAATEPEKIRADLGLDFAPEYLLWATIERSDTVVAPMHGVILDAALTIEITGLTTKTATEVRVEVKELYGQAMPLVAAELAKNLK